MQQIKSSEQKHEQERRDAEQRQKDEQERIEREKVTMQSQLEQLKMQEQVDQKALIMRQEELRIREHELELARTQMEEKEQEHQRQIEQQKKNFEAKEEEIKSQKANKEKIDQLTKEIKPLLDEANEIAKQLGQQITFTFGLTVVNSSDKGIASNLSNYALGEKNYDIQIKVNNEMTDEQYVWDRIKFKERLIVMRDLLITYEELGTVDDLAQDDNPFMDKNEPAIIGEGYFRLEGLGYLMDNPTEINLIGQNYENHGQLSVDVIPVDADGNDELPFEDIPESPEDLLNRRIDYLVCIKSAKDLPQNFCKDVFVEYSIYLEDEKHCTVVIPGKNRDPEFNYQKQHTQTVVTENFLKYVKDEVLTFRLKGFPDVKKQDAAKARRKS